MISRWSAVMAELLPQERLQPSLLDRLTDYEPGSAVESRERRVLSTQQLRAVSYTHLTLPTKRIV